MTNPSASAAPREGALVRALLIVAAAALVLRATAIAQPLGIDQGLWASAVRGMSHGLRLYRDVWEQRPPGIYWVYLAAFNVLGWRAATVAWLDVAAATATTILLFVTVAGLTSRVTAALTACLYAALTMPAALYGHGGFLERSVCETFITMCVAGAAAAAVRIRNGGGPIAGALLGACCGAAVVLKPNAGLYFPALIVWVALYAPARSRWLRVGVVAVVASTVPVVIALFWLWHLGLLHDARVAVLDFNRYYIALSLSGPGSYAVTFSKAVWLRIKTEPLWAAGAAGTLLALWQLARTRTLSPVAALGMLWGIAAALMIIVNGGYLFNSYFINPLPPLAIMGAWALAHAGPKSPRGRRVYALASLAIVVLLLVGRGDVARVWQSASSDLAVLSGRLDRTAYLMDFGGYENNRGYSAVANANLASYVRAHTDVGDRLFLFGINGAGVYFDTDRMPAQRFLRVNDFVGSDFPDPAFRLSAVVDDLERTLPRYVIFERLHSASAMGRLADALPDDPELQPLLRHYHLETRIEDFTLFRLADAGRSGD